LKVPKPLAAAYAETGDFEQAVKAQEAIQFYQEEAVVEPKIEARLCIATKSLTALRRKLSDDNGCRRLYVGGSISQ
jgi:hypothetical protein